MKQPCVYFLASKRDGVLYIGVTRDFAHRMVEHGQGLQPGFTQQHGIKHLVYYEMLATIGDVITREKRLKEWQRACKVRLIETMNPEWRNCSIRRPERSPLARLMLFAQNADVEPGIGR